VPWRLEQADKFRQEVEQYTDAERVVLADAYQALLRYGPLPHPGSPLEVHRLRDPRAGDAYVLVLPQIVVGYQVLGDVIVVQAADVSRCHPDLSNLIRRCAVGSELVREAHGRSADSLTGRAS
jgi:hypothetical protein